MKKGTILFPALVIAGMIFSSAWAQSIEGRHLGPCPFSKIEFYDVISGRIAVFPIPGLRPAEQNPLLALSGGILYRKRPGITATIDSTNVVRESNEGNNGNP